MSIKTEKLTLGIMMIGVGIIAIYQAIFLFFITGIDKNRDLIQAIAIAVLAVLLMVNGTLSIITRNGKVIGDIILGVLSILGASIGLVVWMLLQDFFFISLKNARIEIYFYALLCFAGAIYAEFSVMIHSAIKKHEKELWEKLQFNPDYLNEKYGHPQGVQRASYVRGMEMQNHNRRQDPYGQGTNGYNAQMMDHSNYRQVNSSFQTVSPQPSSAQFSENRKAYGYEAAFSPKRTDDNEDVNTNTYGDVQQNDLFK